MSGCNFDLARLSSPQALPILDKLGGTLTLSKYLSARTWRQHCQNVASVKSSLFVEIPSRSLAVAGPVRLAGGKWYDTGLPGNLLSSAGRGHSLPQYRGAHGIV